MTRVLEVRASDQPLASLQLTREERDDEDDRGAVSELVAATEAFAQGWIEPLAAGLLVECLEPARYDQRVGDPARRSWFTRARSLDARLWLSPGYSDAIEYPNARDDRAELAGMVQAAYDAPCARGVASFAEITWTVVRVRLPVDEVDLRFGGRPVSTLLERADATTWALGPLASSPIGPPLGVRLVNQHGATRLELDIYWDLWLAGGAGRTSLERAIDRVVARNRGWTPAEFV